MWAFGLGCFLGVVYGFGADLEVGERGIEDAEGWTERIGGTRSEHGDVPESKKRSAEKIRRKSAKIQTNFGDDDDDDDKTIKRNQFYHNSQGIIHNTYRIE